jgi:hypothetical protein
MQSKFILKIFFKFNFENISGSSNDGDLLDWYPSQVKGPVDDEVQEGMKIFNQIYSIKFYLFS